MKYEAYLSKLSSRGRNLVSDYLCGKRVGKKDDVNLSTSIDFEGVSLHPKKQRRLCSLISDLYETGDVSEDQWAKYKEYSEQAYEAASALYEELDEYLNTLDTMRHMVKNTTRVYSPWEWVKKIFWGEF